MNTELAGAVLEATKVLGEVADDLLDGKITRMTLASLLGVANALPALYQALIWDYAKSGAMGDDFVAHLSKSLEAATFGEAPVVGQE